MMDFLVYEGKVAVALLVFYLFYRFLLRKETFHRFNRIVLLGTVLLSFLLPLCIITVHKPMDVVSEGNVLPVEIDDASVVQSFERSFPFLLSLSVVLYWAGVLLVLVREIVSILSIVRIVRQGTMTFEEDGCKVVVTEEDIDPFSWMHYIVLSRKDWEGPRRTILVHEKAHIRYGHSVELLLVDILSSLQWFNPAIWMLRSDLQELHEYEADDAVLRGGVNLRNYQFLLIRKAVGKNAYSVANNFNHNMLKNRIAMMCKPVSPRARGFRALYLLPLVCLGLFLQSQTVYETDDKSGGGDEAFAATSKRPQDLDEIIVVRYAREDDGPYPFFLANPETMPTFQGEDRNAFSRWLTARIQVPESCHHTGTMRVGFTVGSDGVVRDVEIQEGVCEELDALIVSLVSGSPKWEPATSGGRPVMQYLTIPIVFTQR